MSARDTQWPAPNGTRRTIQTDSDYRDAEWAVDWLSDQGFAVERVAIVGTGLRSVEQIAGRVTTGRAALIGAGQGTMIGLFLGLLFGLFFDGAAFFGVLFYCLVAGTLCGAFWGAVFHYAQRGRRNFASVAGTRADQYEVQVDEGVAGEAQQLLAGMPARRSQANRAA
jgi:hypothetical protein